METFKLFKRLGKSNPGNYAVGVTVDGESTVSVFLYKALGNMVTGDNLSTENCTLIDSKVYMFTEVFTGDGIQKTIYFTRFGKLTEPLSNDLFKSREGASVLGLLNIDYFTNSEVVTFNSVKKKYCFITTLPTITSLAVTITDYENNNDIYREFFNGSITIGTETPAGKFRKRMLLELPPNDSLAVIEAQIDIVTKILFLLLDKLPEESAQILAEFPQFPTVRSKLQDTSVLTVKSIDNCIKEFDGKQKIRNLQQEYYKLK